MIFFFKISGVCILLFSFLVIYRAVIGPTLIDRMVAVNLIGTKTIIILLIMGLIFERLDMFVDIAIAYALLNFIVSITAAKFLRHYKLLKTNEKWINKGLDV